MIFLSLVGEQPIPNLMPLWQDKRLDQVRLVATSATDKTAQMIENYFRQDAALAHVCVLPRLIVPAYRMGEARMTLARAIEDALLSGQEACLNLTGGTKIMSLAAMQAAYGSGIDLLYISTEENQIIHYRSDGAEYAREPITVRISVDQYLRAHGLETSDSLSFAPTGERPVFHPRQAGDELEETVFEKAKASGYFDDVRRGVFIRKQTDRTPVINELDIVVTLGGRLAVCSCKSGRNVDNDTLYELASLSRREAAGIYCGKVLVCAQTDLPVALRDRARSSGIRLVYGEAVAQVADHLKAALTR